MGYRAILESSLETVQDHALSAHRRLDEAADLYIIGRYHSAIYLGGLAAEMFLKTACFFVGGAVPADPVDIHLTPIKTNKYKPPFKVDFESGHGLWFWSQELLTRRNAQGKQTPRRFLQVLAGLYNDWFIGMRYRPGSATSSEAAAFIKNVEWLAENHATLRR